MANVNLSVNNSTNNKLVLYSNNNNNSINNTAKVIANIVTPVAPEMKNQTNEVTINTSNKSAVNVA